MNSILLFGGTFDPIHHGHLIVARFAADACGCSRIVLIPAASPPHKLDEPITAGKHRLEMCRLAVAGDALFDVSDCEFRRSGPSYTLHTVLEFRKQYGDSAKLHWLIGFDSLVELHTWHRPAELVDLCTFVTVARPGFDESRLEPSLKYFSAVQSAALRNHILESPIIEVSSTQIRESIAHGTSVRYLTPDAVCEYIRANGLYRNAERSS